MTPILPFPPEDELWRQSVMGLLRQHDTDIKRLWRRTNPFPGQNADRFGAAFNQPECQGYNLPTIASQNIHPSKGDGPDWVNVNNILSKGPIATADLVVGQPKHTDEISGRAFGFNISLPVERTYYRFRVRYVVTGGPFSGVDVKFLIRFNRPDGTLQHSNSYTITDTFAVYEGSTTFQLSAAEANSDDYICRLYGELSNLFVNDDTCRFELDYFEVRVCEEGATP